VSECIGAYAVITDLQSELALTFWPERFPVQWPQCGKIPDFVANYLASIACGESQLIGEQVRATVNYLLNELVENSVKFHLSGTIRIRVGLCGDELVLIAINQVQKEKKNSLSSQFAELLQSDPEQLFLTRVEENAAYENRSTSRLGFLSMLVDYNARLGWKFAPVTNDPEKIWLHTMVRVPLQFNVDIMRGALKITDRSMTK